MTSQTSSGDPQLTADLAYSNTPSHLSSLTTMSTTNSYTHNSNRSAPDSMDNAVQMENNNNINNCRAEVMKAGVISHVTARIPDEELVWECVEVLMQQRSGHVTGVLRDYGIGDGDQDSESEEGLMWNRMEQKTAA